MTNQEIINLFQDLSSNMITQYHKELIWLLQNGWIEANEKLKTEHDPEILEDCQDIISMYPYYADWLSNSSFLMFYSYAEEWIFLKIRDTEYRSMIKDNGSITRFKIPLKLLGIDVSRNEWATLSNAEHIRNCLTHCNARVDLTYVKNKKLKRIITNPKNTNYFKINNQRLFVTAEYLNLFKKNIRFILNHPVISTSY